MTDILVDILVDILRNYKTDDFNFVAWLLKYGHKGYTNDDFIFVCKALLAMSNEK